MGWRVGSLAAALVLSVTAGRAAEPATPEMKLAHVPGLAVAEFSGGETAQIRYFGLSDVDTGQPVGPQTLFEGASLTKPLLALWAIDLVNQGLIDLDAPLADRYSTPRITDTDYYATLTPRMILTHRSGMPNWAADPTKPDQPGPIHFEMPPGEAFGYSGEGFMLLQAYLEQESGSTFADFFAARLAPLMPSSSLTAVPAGMVPAWGHDSDGRKGEEARPMRASPFAAGAFSLLTTPADYAAVAQALCPQEGALADLKGTMLVPQQPLEDDPRLAWALGIGMQIAPGAPIVFHWGDNGPFKAFIAFRPDTCDGIVFMANGENGLQLIEALAEPVVGDLDPVIDWLAYGHPGEK